MLLKLFSNRIVGQLLNRNHNLYQNRFTLTFQKHLHSKIDSKDNYKLDEKENGLMEVNTIKDLNIEIPKPKKLVQIELLDQDLEEKFVKGSGPGGQKINKCRHCVQLKHIPTGIRVETQRFRELANNRKEARKLLKLKLDQLYNGKESKLEKKYEKKKKNLAQRKARAKKKYQTTDTKKENQNVELIDSDESLPVEDSLPTKKLK
ncbi:RF-1 domain-containing protein [Globomyces pollinis-pini]|nr:RF-1 domain-containing protein [Globomyces pollinis-pini]